MFILWSLFHLLLLIISTSLFPKTNSYIIRPATEKDVSEARKLLFQQAMNPLAISTTTMLVAIDSDADASRERLLGFGQIRPLDENYSELASLFVLPEHRHQKIGSTLVQTLLQRHRANPRPTKVCLLTLKPTMGFYEPFGFQEADKEKLKVLPKPIQLEFQAGKVLSFLLGNEVVCMAMRD